MKDSPHSLPESTPASPLPESVSPSTDEPEAQTGPALDHLPAEHRDVVRRLFQQVQAAVDTIEDLRAENERLRRRIAELEAEPEYPDDETVLALDDNPAEVRERITQFINTIDTYLDPSPTAEPASEDANA